MTRTCALYTVPATEHEQAHRFGDFESGSPAQARRARREAVAAGDTVAIHVGDTHPETLPFGEKLWLEPNAKAPT